MCKQCFDLFATHIRTYRHKYVCGGDFSHILSMDVELNCLVIRKYDRDLNNNKSKTIRCGDKIFNECVLCVRWRRSKVRFLSITQYCHNIDSLASQSVLFAEQISIESCISSEHRKRNEEDTVLLLLLLFVSIEWRSTTI